MIIFHFAFNLNYFNFISIDIINNIFWKSFRLLIVFMFLFSFGYSLQLSNKIFNLRKNFKKLSILLSMCLLITFSTYMIFPNTWIYFGILHFIFVSYIISFFLLKFSASILFIIALSFYTLYNIDILSTNFIYEFTKEYLNLPSKTQDLVRFFPWYSVVLLGIAASKIKLLEYFNIQSTTKWILFLGQNSLMIYMTHQIILFSLIYLLSLL